MCVSSKYETLKTKKEPPMLYSENVSTINEPK